MATITKTIGTASTIDTETPSSCSGSGPYTVTFVNDPTGVVVGDKAYITDEASYYDEFVYNVTGISGSSYTLTYVSGGYGTESPCSLYNSFYEQAAAVFKRAPDYATPRAWAADLDDASIYSNGDDAVGEITVNEKYDEGIGIANGSTVTLNSVKLTVASSVRHNGTAGSGAGFKYTAQSSSGGGGSLAQVVDIKDADNVTLEWLEFDGTGVAGSCAIHAFVTDHGNFRKNNTVRNCVMHGFEIETGGSSVNMIRMTTSTSSSVSGESNYILNNIIYGNVHSTIAGGSPSAIWANSGRAANPIYVYNNTINDITARTTSDSAYGIKATLGSVVINNIASDVSGSTTSECFAVAGGTWSASSDYNLSTDTTAPGSNSVTSATLANIYESDSGTVNLHLKSGSPAIDAGTDLGTTPSGVEIDIDGRNRDSEGDTWDIGADEYVVNGIEVAPTAASFVAAAVSPTSALGSLTVTVSAAAMVAAAISPTITFSSTTATPTAATVIAQAISPTTLLGNLSITPSAASFVAACVDPTVGGAISISPASASLTTAASASTVQGALSITPAAASGVATATSPSIVEGTLSIGPAAASITATAVSPSLSFSSVTVTPTAAAFVATGISPTAVFGSTTVTPTAGSFESLAISPTVVFSSSTATPAAATLTTAATATVVQGSISVSVTGSTIEVIGVSPTAVSSSIAITPEAAVTVSQVLVGAIIQGNLLVVIPAVVQLDYAAVAPTVVFGSDTATSAAAVAVTSASASIDLDDLSITPSAAVVALNTVSPTILAGETITASAAVIVTNVPPVTVSASFDAASLDYSIAGVLDYECNGNTDYSLSGQLNYNA